MNSNSKRFGLMVMVFLPLVLAVFVSQAQASHLVVADPVRGVYSANDVIDLGVVGPGQKIEIVVERASGEDARGITYKKEALWDKLFVASEFLPLGWVQEDAKWYETPMRAFVTVAKDAVDGEYFFVIRAFDEYEGVAPLEVRCRVTVSRELLEAELLEKTISVGVDQPALYFLRLKNKSSASDAFQVTVVGLPSTVSVEKKVFLRHNSEEIIPIELMEGERGEYSLLFLAKSLSSDSINAGDSGLIIVFSSLLNDMKAVGNGILLFPSVEQAIHALLGLMAYFAS